MKVISILVTLSISALASAAPAVDKPSTGEPAKPTTCCEEDSQPVCIRGVLDILFPVAKCGDKCNQGTVYCCETKETVVCLQ